MHQTECNTEIKVRVYNCYIVTAVTVTAVTINLKQPETKINFYMAESAPQTYIKKPY